MTKNTYTYRIRVAGESTGVQAEIRDPQENVRGEPSGNFRYQDYQERIEALAGKAFAGKADKYVLVKREIRELGEALFNALFDPELRTSFLTWYDRVVHGENGGLLRVELDVDERRSARLAALPWEFLCVPQNQITGSLWLATAPRLIFSRRRALWNPAAPIQLEPGEKLRIAMAVAAPQDLGVVKFEKLWQELEELAQQNAQLELLPLVNPATREAIDATLEQKPHIFHFLGHGRLLETDGRQQGEIAILRPPNIARWVDAQQFGSLFNRHRPGIVVLQACEGAAGSTSQAFVSVASQIVRQNVPVVLAMQYEISNATARAFSREFYRRLSQGKPVDEAAQEGRNEIADFHESRDFATPVLFMRVRRGQIFLKPEEEQDAGIPVENGDETSGEGEQVVVESDEPVLSRVRKVLLDCGEFHDNAAVVQILATTPSLRLWRHSVPGAVDAGGRVDAVMAFLLDKFRADTNENGLVLFLQSLSAKKEEGDRCKGALARLAEELSREVKPPQW
jgi:hypothetical protein